MYISSGKMYISAGEMYYSCRHLENEMYNSSGKMYISTGEMYYSYLAVARYIWRPPDRNNTSHNIQYTSHSVSGGH